MLTATLAKIINWTPHGTTARPPTSYCFFVAIQSAVPSLSHPQHGIAVSLTLGEGNGPGKALPGGLHETHPQHSNTHILHTPSPPPAPTHLTSSPSLRAHTHHTRRTEKQGVKSCSTRTGDFLLSAHASRHHRRRTGGISPWPSFAPRTKMALAMGAVAGVLVIGAVLAGVFGFRAAAPKMRAHPHRI